MKTLRQILGIGLIIGAITSGNISCKDDDEIRTLNHEEDLVSTNSVVTRDFYFWNGEDAIETNIPETVYSTFKEPRKGVFRNPNDEGVFYEDEKQCIEENYPPSIVSASSSSSQSLESISSYASENETFAITYPVSGGTGQYINTMTGMGIKKPVKSSSCRVYTDKWYDQTGVLSLGEKGSWSYSPLYLGGDGQYNLHDIRFKVTYTDGTSEDSVIQGVIRKN